MSKKYEIIDVKKSVSVPVFDTSYEEVCRNLTKVSVKLRDLLPDPSIGPEERVERLARVVPESLLMSQYHKTARVKWNYITDRLNHLVPDTKENKKTALEKIDILLEKLHLMIPGQEKRIFIKLEKLGDHRVSDTGR